MQRAASVVVAPLSYVETAVLGATATGDGPDGVEHPDWIAARESLRARGLLTRESLVTPEGLAALLDAVPIDSLTGMPSRAAVSAVARLDAPSDRNRAPRKSAAPSARRARARN